MKLKPQDYLTEEIDYDRPAFNFPDLSGEQGNPIVYFALVNNVLVKHGYHYEASLLTGKNGLPIHGMIIPESTSLLSNTPYDEQFDLLNKFISIEDPVTSEDEDFIYMKVRKGKQVDLTNPPTIKMLAKSGVEVFKEFYKDSAEDLKIQNCYGRTVLNYIEKPESMEFLLKQFENDDSFLFHVDNFMTSILSTAQNIQTFLLIGEHFEKRNPELLKLFLYNTDKLGRTALDTLNNLSNDAFKKKSYNQDIEDLIIKTYSFLDRNANEPITAKHHKTGELVKISMAEFFLKNSLEKVVAQKEDKNKISHLIEQTVLKNSLSEVEIIEHKKPKFKI